MINELRNQIDRIDSQILLLLNRRMAVVRKIKNEKNISGLPVKDSLREKKQYQSWQNKVNRKYLNKLFILKFFRLVINESRRIQNEK